MPGRALIKEADVVMSGSKKTRKVLKLKRILLKSLCTFLSYKLGEFTWHN